MHLAPALTLAVLRVLIPAASDEADAADKTPCRPALEVTHAR